MVKMKYIGVDVGKNGGIAILDGNRNLQLYTIPKIKTKVDLPSLVNLINSLDDDSFVCIEDVHSIHGSSAKSNFEFGKIAGTILGMVVYRELPYALVPPKTWQSEIWTTPDKVYKPSKKHKSGRMVDTKPTSLLAAKRLFPKESFLATERSTKPHDGLYDSALIAEYCKRVYG